MQRRHFLTAAASAATAVLSSGCDPAPRTLAGGFAGIDMARGHQLRDLLAQGTLPAPAVVRRAQVVIAGGGVAGLAAARSLRLAGVDDFALLELEDTAGGNSRGGQVNGIACPLGAHYLPVPGDDAREVQDLLEELGLRTTPYHAHVPSCGEWGFVIARRRPWHLPVALPGELRFLSADTLPLLFDFPLDMARVPTEVNRLSNQALVHTYEREWGKH